MSKPVAIITGAGKGIGRAAAIQLAGKGYDLVLIARTEADLNETARLAGGGMIAVADITKAQEIDRVVAAAVERFGRIDALVNNAGYAPILKVEETTADEWHRVIDTNLTAAFFFSKAVWPIFRGQSGGVIVNMSSLACRDPFMGFTAYGAAKAGLNLMGLALAREGEPLGIRVHTIAPGATETEMFRAIATKEQFSPQRTLDPADVARIIVQCISGELQHTSGEVIYLHKRVS